jgi:site-specific DNA-cytosine methylase
MDTQITLNENKDIVYSSFKLHKNGLSAIGTPTLEQWEECGKFIRKCQNSSLMWWGDWVNYGEHSYGEKYSQAVDQSDYEKQSLKDAAYVAKNVDPSIRIDDWGHNRLLAPLAKEPELQKKLSDLVKEKKLTVQELNVYIKEAKKDIATDDIDDRPIVPYGENIYYLTTAWQDRPSDFIYVDDKEPLPTLKRRSWFYHKDTKAEFSLREYAQVQNFPDTFKFVGTYEKIKDQIGNAVSPKMAHYIGQELKGITIGDLFAGCGGLSCGLEMLGKKSKWAIERSVDYARTYKVNHPESKVFTRDIKKLDPKNFEKVDIIVGGPPCQGFSMSGIRFKDDPRNQLYKEFVRFVDVLKPGEFLLENVAQIQEAEEQIKADFEAIGYTVKTQLVKGEEIGMRQHRHRFFFIGKYGNNT